LNSKQLLTAAVVSLSVTMSFVPVTFASPNVQQTLNTQDNPSPQKVNIRQVIVVDEDKFRLVGAGDFRRRTIRIVPQAGETLVARYDAAQKMFVTVGRKKVVPGIRYEVKADWARIPKNQALFVIPNLLEAKQVGPNRIELLFDRPVNLQSATRAGSYWVRNNLDRPADIASIGKNDPVTRETALTPNRVAITPVDRTGTHLLMTFTVNATPGVRYTVIPCFITTPDRSGYNGGNYSPASRNTFIARRF
jgi:hypothetical protein